MPQAVVAKVAEKIGKAEAERLWKKAQDIASKQYPDVEKKSSNWYAIVMGIYKKMTGYGKSEEAFGGTGMELLLEDYFSDEPYELISESSKLPSGTILIVKGPIGITETKNLNGRIYTNDFWGKVLSRDSVVNELKERSLIGSADHPKSFVPPMATVSHVLVEASIDPNTNTLYGTSEVLDFPMGRIVKSCYDCKLKVGASTRGGGMTKRKDGADYVLEDGYKWGGFDFCFKPSAQNAYPVPVRESVEQVIYESSIDELGETEDSRDMYKRVLSKFGCNVAVIQEKFSNMNKRFFIVPSSYKTESPSYTNGKVSVVEVVGNEVPEDSIELKEDLFDQIREMKEKIKALSEKVLDLVGGSSLPPGEKGTLEEEISVKSSEISTLKESNSSLSKSLREINALYSSAEKKLSSAKEIMGDKVLTFSRTVESFQDEIRLIKVEKDTLEEQISSLQEENGSMKKKLKSDQSREIAELKEKVNRLSKQKKSLILELDELKDELSEVKKVYYAFKSGLSEREVEDEGINQMSLDEYNEVFNSVNLTRKSGIMDEAPKIKKFEIHQAKRRNPGRVSQITEILSLMGGKNG